jgi:hypothetical protein
MVGGKFVEVATGTDSRFKMLYVLVCLLSFLGLVLSDTGMFLKLAVVGALFLFCCFSAWKIRQQEAICRLRIYNNGAVTLINQRGAEIYGVLDEAGWITRSVSLVKVGLFDQWKPQQFLVCASLNSAAEYRHLLKRLRLDTGKKFKDGILSG